MITIRVSILQDASDDPLRTSRVLCLACAASFQSIIDTSLPMDADIRDVCDICNPDRPIVGDL